MGDLVNIDDYTKRLTEELKTKFGDRLLDISTSHRELFVDMKK